jgi:hypothetical protein
MRKMMGDFSMLLLCMVCLAGCKQPTSCEPGAQQACYCPNGKVKEQTCNADGTSWSACECTYYSAWCDNATGLCWQDPQKDAFDNDDTGVMPGDAVRYCDQVAFGGYSDWRLPTIEELRTLVRGNPKTEADGECPLVEGSTNADMNDPACGPLTEWDGPGVGGCYWPPELGGTCHRPDPASLGHPLEFAASTRCPDAPTKGWYGVVMFETSAVCWNHINTYSDVRCVRDEPTTFAACAEQASCMPGATRRCLAKNLRVGSQVCSADGECWGTCDRTSFKESPPPKDICASCTQIRLTVRVPDKLAKPPVQLMAFLYAADTWTFPPNRPPDGGNSECQVKNPVIDLDKPFIMTVPTCTYYRKQCLKGEYKLYVAIMQSETMPPTMAAGDYWWGDTAEQPEPITLGSGAAETIEMDITLVPWAQQ